MSLADHSQVQRLIALAREEDLGSGDVSAALLPRPAERATFRLLAQQEGIFAGREIAEAVLRAFDERIEIVWQENAADGAQLANPPVTLALLQGPLASLLAAERVLLNFLQRLSGVATVTRRFVDAVAGTAAAIYDTRKTTPGWRLLEKYAVRCGGGRNHRTGLYDAVMLKDNHLAGLDPSRLAAEVFSLLNRLSDLPGPPAFVEVEVDTPAHAEALFSVVGIDVILLDNFRVEDLAATVRRRDELGLKGKVELEASGGVTLGTVRRVAETGVERISVGALTHSATALNLSMERV